MESEVSEHEEAENNDTECDEEEGRQEFQQHLVRDEQRLTGATSSSNASKVMCYRLPMLM